MFIVRDEGPRDNTFIFVLVDILSNFEFIYLYLHLYYINFYTRLFLFSQDFLVL
jgi:hypothetical protein